MNYWESRKSFWTKPVGIVIQLIIILTILGSAIIALNIFTSPFPIIESLAANPAVIGPGDISTLCWSVVGAAKIELDAGIGELNSEGCREISPSETTTYTLTATNGTRVRTKSVKIKVEG